MTLKPGVIETLTVARENEFGYFLSQQGEDILLHKREAKGELKEDEKVTVFLYLDHEGRLTATMEMPIISLGEMGWLKVVSQIRNQGLFLYNGTSRDVFFSMDDLPPERERWPAEGDELFVTLSTDKKGRLMAKHVYGKPIEDQSVKAGPEMYNKDVEGIVYKMGEDVEGVNILTDEKHLAFLHNDDMNSTVRLGQKIAVRVTNVREDGRLNVSQKPRKQEALSDDAEKIIQYMEGRNGAMPYWDKSQAEDIYSRFQLSKAAFKRALGKLMKEGKVYQEEGWTYFKERK
ncbi:CvfB family protein [Bacillus sp. FJAT-45350]|uniref:CvfB family protein n=1 Tax=Bacillus sp. FJAT-45350 TaxID=2011014 RepID=UPI000BB8F057|nr:S1-like domain-containing RNA-binding protein [Bacillus sp. FJAT-45350]